LKQAGVPKKLETKIVGESLFNDGVGVVVFLTILGVIAHIGMCTIDFVFWSFEDDHESRNNLFEHLSKVTSIWHPFMIIGPSLLFVGLATHAWSFIRSKPMGAIMTLMGAVFVGVANFIWDERIYVVISILIFAIGLVILLYKKEGTKITSNT
jgi:NhaP-type Na+/H+ or K+/H+ antiporter